MFLSRKHAILTKTTVLVWFQDGGAFLKKIMDTQSFQNSHPPLPLKTTGTKQCTLMAPNMHSSSPPKKRKLPQSLNKRQTTIPDNYQAILALEFRTDRAHLIHVSLPGFFRLQVINAKYPDKQPLGDFLDGFTELHGMNTRIYKDFCSL